MRALNELVIRGPQADLLSLLGRLEASMTKGWRRDRVLEERLRGTGTGGASAFCFLCDDASGRPAAALWLQARSAEEWYISNIVPLVQRELSAENYNQILEEFQTTFLEPLTCGSSVHPKIVRARTLLDDLLSPRACQQLRTFSSVANRTAWHPSDQWHWQDFIVQAHREAAPLDREMLEDWLRGDGWPEERRTTLASEYQTGRALLAHYDRDAQR